MRKLRTALSCVVMLIAWAPLSPLLLVELSARGMLALGYHLLYALDALEESRPGQYVIAKYDALAGRLRGWTWGQKNGGA